MQRQNPKKIAPPLSCEPAYATVAEAAAYLRLCRATIYALMDGGKLAYAKFGGARRIAWQALRDYAESCTVAAV
jgi:excisionase family DNA binding protein